MKRRFTTAGSTLVETLVAVAIMVAIVSMLYGSYFVTAKTTQVCKARIAMLQQGREVLEQMARQIRGSYARPAVNQTSETIPQQRKILPPGQIDYFGGDADGPNGEILHLITANGPLAGQYPGDGLFEVTYKFDRKNRALFVNRESLLDPHGRAGRKNNWQPIAANISSIDLAFLDGQQWLPRWNLSEKKKLPYAVKIEICCEDENLHQSHYGTVAYVQCSQNQGRQTRVDRLVAVDK